MARVLVLADGCAGDPAVAVHEAALSPAPGAVVEVAAIVSRKDGFLRAQPGEAIDALAADGTLDAITDDSGISHRRAVPGWPLTGRANRLRNGPCA